MPDVTLGLLLAGKRRVLRFPDMVMAHNFTAHARFLAVAPTDQALRVVDVGACVGGWTAALLLAAPNAVVTCVEPNPAAWPYLLNNVGWNRSVTVLKAAASASGGDVLIYRDAQNVGKTSIYGQGEAVAALATRLDDAVAGPVDLLKIDAEGHELKVLAGAERILSAYHPTVIVEVLGAQMARGGWTETELVLGMRARGYGDPEKLNANDWMFRVKG